MLESFPENLRRAMFFARNEAVQDGSAYIECRHLLLGLLRQTPTLAAHICIQEAQIRRGRGRKMPWRTLGRRASVPPRHRSFRSPPMSKTAMHLAAAAADQIGASEIGRRALCSAALFLADTELRADLETAGLTQEKLTELLPGLMHGIRQSVNKRTDTTARISLVSRKHKAESAAELVMIFTGLHAGRKMMIGGIEVPFDRGPVGHSDGDVLIHALCDALLGAAASGDIGTHFPDTDPQWKDAASLSFLVHVRELLADRKIEIVYHRRSCYHRAPKAHSTLSENAGRSRRFVGN